MEKKELGDLTKNKTQGIRSLSKTSKSCRFYGNAVRKKNKKERKENYFRKENVKGKKYE
jgi:hypothetical protein